MQDPLKIFYHRTQFYSLYDGTVPEVFRDIPGSYSEGRWPSAPTGRR